MRGLSRQGQSGTAFGIERIKCGWRMRAFHCRLLTSFTACIHTQTHRTSPSVRPRWRRRQLRWRHKDGFPGAQPGAPREGEGGRTAPRGGRGHDSSESGGDVTKGNTPAAAVAGSDSNAGRKANTPSCSGGSGGGGNLTSRPRTAGSIVRRGRDGFN